MNPSIEEYSQVVRRDMKRRGRAFRRWDDDWSPALYVPYETDILAFDLSAFFRSDEGETVLASVALPALLLRLQAQLAALAVSTWTAVGTVNEFQAMPPAQRQAIEEGRIHDLPERLRTEQVQVAVADQQRVRTWKAAIRRDPRRPPTLGVWQWEPLYELADAWAFPGLLCESLQVVGGLGPEYRVGASLALSLLPDMPARLVSP